MCLFVPCRRSVARRGGQDSPLSTCCCPLFCFTFSPPAAPASYAHCGKYGSDERGGAVPLSAATEVCRLGAPAGVRPCDGVVTVL